jgi:hypothetical protein
MQRWLWRQYARLLARFKSPKGYFWLGLLAEAEGEGQPAIEEANRWYRLAARAGHVNAMWNLAANRLAGNGGRRDPEEALFWLQRAADAHHPMASWALAGLYLAGSMVERDSAKGIALLRRSAETGFAPACIKLAECYHQGQHGLPKDRASAAQWVARADTVAR